MQIFNKFDYRQILRDSIEYRKQLDSKYLFVHFAKRIGVQAPYLSRVLKENGHLNSDQLDLACSELNFTDDERNYIFQVFEFQRSGNFERKKRLKNQIDILNREFLNTKNHLQANSLDEASERSKLEYYLEPLSPVVHGFLHIEAYNRNPIKIAQCLGCTFEKLSEIIKNLEQLGVIIKKTKEPGFEIKKSYIHLDKNSAINNAYQTLTRNLYQEQLRRIKSDDKHQYTVTISTSPETADLIYQEFNNFLKKTEELVQKSKSIGVYQLSFDFFKWDSLFRANSENRTELSGHSIKLNSQDSNGLEL